MTELQKYIKKMYDKGYRHLVKFGDGTPQIFIFNNTQKDDYPSQDVIGYCHLTSDGNLI